MIILKAALLNRTSEGDVEETSVGALLEEARSREAEGAFTGAALALSAADRIASTSDDRDIIEATASQILRGLGISRSRVRSVSALRQLREFLASSGVDSRSTDLGHVLTTSCTYVGGHGYPLRVQTLYSLVFSDNELRAEDASGEAASLPYVSLISIDVSGSGRTTTGGGFMGGGFGLGGAAEGIAVAALLNTLTTRTQMNTVLRIQSDTGELFFHNDAMTPDELRIRLSPIYTKLRQRAAIPAPSTSNDVIGRLSALADLRDRGAITAEEFEKLKGDLLRE